MTLEENGKAVAILGAPGSFQGGPDAPLSELFKKTGLNTGNLAFFRAVTSHVVNEKVYIPWEFDVKHVNSSCSALIMPAANMINNYQDHRELGERFDQLTVPTAIVGLGIQMPLGSPVTDLQIPDGTRFFLEVLARRGTRIGCRGESTQRFLAAQGLNADVIGCPSNFLSSNENLGLAVSEKFGDFSRGILGQVDYSSRLSLINNRILDWVEHYGGMINIQDPLAGILFAMRDPGFLKDPGNIKQAANVFGISECELLQKVSPKTIAFMDFPSWFLFSKSMSLSVGTRLHGNMIAFQAETPAVFVPHDERVNELVETMGLPKVTMHDFLQAETLPELIQHVRFSPFEYETKRLKLVTRYVSILSNCGVTVSEDLAKFMRLPEGQTILDAY